MRAAHRGGAGAHEAARRDAGARGRPTAAPRRAVAVPRVPSHMPLPHRPPHALVSRTHPCTHPTPQDYTYYGLASPWLQVKCLRVLQVRRRAAKSSPSGASAAAAVAAAQRHWLCFSAAPNSSLPSPSPGPLLPAPGSTSLRPRSRACAARCPTSSSASWAVRSRSRWGAACVCRPAVAARALHQAGGCLSKRLRVEAQGQPPGRHVSTHLTKRRLGAGQEREQEQRGARHRV